MALAYEYAPMNSTYSRPEMKTEDILDISRGWRGGRAGGYFCSNGIFREKRGFEDSTTQGLGEHQNHPR